MILDIGPATVTHVTEVLHNCRTPVERAAAPIPPAARAPTRWRARRRG